MRKRFAFPNPVVWIVPKIFEGFPPVTRPSMFDVPKPESLRKFPMLLVGTPNSPKLWNKLGPLPGLVPPVMLYWTWPLGRLIGPLTCVFRPPEGVIGAGTWARLGALA